MGFITAADPASKATYVFTNAGQLHDAIKERGYIPVRADLQPYIVQEFEGGYLLDGAPLNVYIDGQWFTGQRELLEPYWKAGTIPTPPQSVLDVGMVEMPEEVRETYETFKKSETLFGLGIPTPVLLGAGLLGWFLLRR
jgi:hypothetical protein